MSEELTNNASTHSLHPIKLSDLFKVKSEIGRQTYCSNLLPWPRKEWRFGGVQRRGSLQRSGAWRSTVVLSHPLVCLNEWSKTPWRQRTSHHLSSCLDIEELSTVTTVSQKIHGCQLLALSSPDSKSFPILLSPGNMDDVEIQAGHMYTSLFKTQYLNIS